MMPPAYAGDFAQRLDKAGTSIGAIKRPINQQRLEKYHRQPFIYPTTDDL